MAALETQLTELQKQYDDFKTLGLQLNMARGKPGSGQLDLSAGLLGAFPSYKLEDGTDARNYGILNGIPECRNLFAGLLGINADRIIAGASSSLNVMFDTMASLCLFGTGGGKPWHYYKFEGTPVKFLCPVPGYDRHFTICEELGIEMIPVPLLEDGPDMDMVSELAAKDPLIKGIWCVPLYSNPEGVCYSDEVVDRLASMETAAEDFRIFWDNAYGVHHFEERTPLKDILAACESAGHPDRTYYFFSTSKITFPGAGVALVASGEKNINELKKHMSAQTIGHNKLNQLHHVQFFKTPEGIRHHMELHAKELAPRFQMVLDWLEREISGTGYARWTSPKGGYFISLYTKPGCASRTVELAKNAGLTLTPAGAAYPYGNDPEDSHIRIAPSYPSLEELEKAMKLFCICIKLAATEHLLKEEKEN
ncbi:aminotransferase class I/II-fold pyridoxal phosphate-dependent enzyme [Bariatricus massiliensis]|uniref:Aminotransferase class I/II-fold pyridoxal phosphate-dependent enzyme n=1 Tax=Bariatricus massiliensis TaxID=1745713 RepID=A0ABS8DE89_9FIRM|nr:aminotransferase class I/II-fold pyridoxal phosphate-dependent enzyme [Bariatricus massiliensis]MCB7302822.1 aminotransferase class I/II-fold pyridoxal phosphate-dependent enzyme [Bariatricus massiliensis]MCB7374038.1 aminotransferase class I/II-fold pyridoxal phosphate-dependent enzyme [Bariatricus massiliensis]MCB7386708.1 aminotransferase class I/II-fold pyridoxal phosphate-dependent enzyme [Bariatricus massiliensis]MCB7410870.1 aminotransferase class I/II-fold pyridoxal phosphate-depende